MNVQSKVEAATLASAMALAFGEFEGAAKGKTNPAFKSKYADLESVIEAVKPSLVKHGLFFTQRTHDATGGVCIETVVHHVSGEEMRFGRLFVPAGKQDAQGFGSALTYARRYSLMTAFGIAPEDDDGNAAVRHPHEAKAVPFAQEAPPKPRQALEGPHTSPSTLKGAVKAIVHALEGFSDADEFEAYMATPDVKGTVAQCERDMPDWYFGGPTVPGEFIPLQIRIANKRRELEELETIRVRNPIAAG